MLLVQQRRETRQVARMKGPWPFSVERSNEAVENDEAPPRQGGRVVAKPHPRPSRLSPEQKQKVLEFQEEGEEAHGHRSDLWGLHRAVDVIEKRFGMRSHQARAWWILRARGWKSRKAKWPAREENEDATVGWRKESWHPAKKRVRERSSQRNQRHHLGVLLVLCSSVPFPSSLANGARVGPSSCKAICLILSAELHRWPPSREHVFCPITPGAQMMGMKGTSQLSHTFHGLSGSAEIRPGPRPRARHTPNTPAKTPLLRLPPGHSPLTRPHRGAPPEFHRILAVFAVRLS
jgi:transposase